MGGISVVVPVYRGSATIAELTERLRAVLEPCETWELIFVVDGSPDNSWSVVEELAAAHEFVRGIELFRNFGQHNALLAGIRTARHSVVVTMDDDLQHRPETLPALLELLTDDVDLVYGQAENEEHGWWRNLTSRVAKTMIAATVGSKVARDASALRVFRTSLRDGFSNVSDPYISIDVVLSWVTNRYTTCRVPMDQRLDGASGSSVRKLIRHALNTLTGYSTKPLRIVTWLGFCMALFGLGVLAFVVGRRLHDGTAVPGFAFMASLVSLLAGAQLFGLGVIGEYLGRIHIRSMQQLPYVVRRRTSQPTQDQP